MSQLMHPHTRQCQVHVDDPHTDIQVRLALAQQTCQQHGWRMTALRAQVFEIILRSPKPIGAYEILAQLQAQAVANQQKSIAPPTVYRSLAFLIAHGFVHQLNSANAFIPCCHPREQHLAAFLICQHCQQVEEFSATTINEMLSSVVEQANFTVKQSVIEMMGICAICQTKQTDVIAHPSFCEL